MRLLGKLVLPFALLLAAPVVSSAKEVPAIPADLANYISKTEPEAGWKLEDSKDFGIAKVWRLKLTSQVWQGIT